MCGKGNGSFGQALLRSVKSMQSLHFPFAFRTTTGFSNHVGCNTPLTKPAASSFLISSAMNCCRSKACFRTFCLMGRACGQIARWCSITSLGTPGISDGCQGNTSIFARRKATSALSYLSSRVALIVKVPSMPASPARTFFTWGCSELRYLTIGTLRQVINRRSALRRGMLPGFLASILAILLLSSVLLGGNCCCRCLCRDYIPVQLVHANDCILLI